MSLGSASTDSDALMRSCSCATVTVTVTVTDICPMALEGKLSIGLRFGVCLYRTIIPSPSRTTTIHVVVELLALPSASHNNGQCWECGASTRGRSLVHIRTWEVFSRAFLPLLVLESINS